MTKQFTNAINKLAQRHKTTFDQSTYVLKAYSDNEEQFAIDLSVLKPDRKRHTEVSNNDLR